MYDIEKIKTEIDYLVFKHQLDDCDQICLQRPAGEINFRFGNGPIESNGDWTDSDFVNLNITEDWEMAKFIINEKLARTRIMFLEPSRCYSYHRDWTPRVHLAITTTPRCLMVVDDKAFHIPADGNPHTVDTTKMHTALNGSKDPKITRIHLVGCVLQ